jgi:hypothetical protein
LLKGQGGKSAIADQLARTKFYRAIYCFYPAKTQFWWALLGIRPNAVVELFHVLETEQ